MGIAHSSPPLSWLVAAMVFGSAAADLTGQNEAQIIHSTHDWNSTQTASLSGTEVWTDVKSPGDGRVYTVGSLTVTQVLAAQTAGYFSLALVEKSPSNWFAIPAGGTHQVVLVQVTDATQTILWQRYFYGQTTIAPQSTRDANARAIAVWPNVIATQGRVAICGETFDSRLPLSQLGGAAPTGNVASGFVAVYDGDGALQWTYQFYSGEHPGHCGVTDLSVRVEQSGGVTYDVVTYCGISSYGLVSSGTVAPVQPFTNVPAVGTYVPGVGNSPLPAGQWDGFVGRLRHNRTTGITTTEFHSNVGGSDQDGLFGLAEIAPDVFVVTGSTRKNPGAGTSPYAFPFTAAYDFSGYPTYDSWNQAEDFGVGCFLGFDASTLTTTGLRVRDSVWLGSVTRPGAPNDVWTVSHDLVATPYTGSLYIVGTTSDPDFLAETSNPFLATTAHGSKATMLPGDCDGFAVWVSSYPGLGAATVGLFGTDNNDGISGVSRWSEHFASAAFVGWEQVGGVPDIRCGSLAHGGRGLSLAGAAGTAVRERRMTAAGLQIPAAMGSLHAQLNGTASPPPPGYLLDEPAAGRSHGGVAVDQEGRVTLVGHSFSSSYPYQVVVGSGFVDGRGPSSLSGVAFDAVRTVADMLPLGVSRTEGSGTDPYGHVPRQAQAPHTGGTTPVGSCQAPFGWQIGVTPLPEVSRLHIDYLGDAPASGGSTRLLSVDGYFPPNPWTVAAMQFGFPGPSNNYVPYTLPGSTVELWSVNSPSYLPQSGTGASYTEFQLPAFPAGPLILTVQGVWFLQSALACDPAGVIATPGLVIWYL